MLKRISLLTGGGDCPGLNAVIRAVTKDALHAGIEVVGLVEALPECGGYKVHKDKLVRMGVPVHTRHTVVSANGEDHVESVTVAAIAVMTRNPSSVRTFISPRLSRPAPLERSRAPRGARPCLSAG